MKLTPKPLTSLLFAALGLISVSAFADAEDAEKKPAQAECARRL